MRLVVDLQGAQTQSSRRGVGRFTRSLTDAMLRECRGHEIVLACNAAFPEAFEDLRRRYGKLIPYSRIRAWRSPVVRTARDVLHWRSRMGEPIREAFLASLEPDAVHVSSLMEGLLDEAVTGIGGLRSDLPTGAMLFDLTPLAMPDKYLSDPTVTDWYNTKIEHLKRADLHLVMSDFVRREAIELLGLAPDRVVTIATGVDDVFLAPPLEPGERSRVARDFGIGDRFVLYYGGFDVHKNVEALVTAMGELRCEAGQQVDLVIVGSCPASVQQHLNSLADASGLPGSRRHWLGRVPDEGLVDLLRAAEVFVYPSLREGFGLPVLEAMAAGAPVICSDRSSLPEVAGNNDVLLDPSKPGSLAAKLRMVLGEPGFRNDIAERGRLRAREFTWGRAASRTFDAYEALHERRRNEAGLTRPAATPAKDVAEAVAALVPRNVDGATFANIAHAIATNRPQPGPARLLVDVTVQASHAAGSGISRVVDRIATHLLDLSSETVPIELVATDYRGGFRHAGTYQSRLRGQSGPADDDRPVELRAGDHFLGLDLNHALPTQQQFLERLAQLGGRRSAVVFDLLPLQRPDWFPPGLARAHSAWLATLADLDDLVCISAAVADDVTRELDRMRPANRQPKVGFFHLGAELPGNPAGERPASFHERPTILVVSVLWARKGHAFALEAFERLWGEGAQVNLAFAGRAGWGVDSLLQKLMNHPELGQRLFWFDGPDDALLAMLYREAAGVLLPTEGEGFGLPLVEALQYGRPVLARDLPVFTEVAGEHFDRFTSDTPEGLAGELREWLQRIETGRTPAADGFRPVTWPESTRQLLKALALEL